MNEKKDAISRLVGAVFWSSTGTLNSTTPAKVTDLKGRRGLLRYSGEDMPVHSRDVIVSANVSDDGSLTIVTDSFGPIRLPASVTTEGWAIEWNDQFAAYSTPGGAVMHFRPVRKFEAFGDWLLRHFNHSPFARRRSRR